MNLFDNLSFRVKLAAAPALCLLLLGIMVGFALSGFSRLSTAIDNIGSRQLPKYAFATKLATGVRDMHGLMNRSIASEAVGYTADEVAKMDAELGTSASKLSKVIDEAIAGSTDERERTALESIRGSFQKYKVAMKDTLDMKSTGLAMASTFLLAAQNSYASLVTQTSNYADEKLLQANQQGVQASEAAQKITTVMLAMGLGALIAGFGVSLSLANRLAQRVSALLRATQRIADGDLTSKVEVTSKDEVELLMGAVATMQARVAERTEQVRQRTADIQSMLQNMPQGVLTVTPDITIHPEYSAYLETIFETNGIAGKNAIALLFSDVSIGSDALAQVEAAVSSCIGEDRLNFDFNSHLFVTQVGKTMADGRVKSLEFSWSPICDANDVVEKMMICVRDVTELRRLEEEAGARKRQLEIIGQILALSQEKFSDFIEGSLAFIEDNRHLIEGAELKDSKDLDRVNLLFRNMHTIKGNARTFGLIHLTNLVHETEQAYDELRKSDVVEWEPKTLLTQLDAVKALVEEYAQINDNVLGRKGPGRRGAVEKYVMVERDQVESSLRLVSEVNQGDIVAVRSALNQVSRTLSLIGTERIEDVLGGIVDSLPSLATELGKAPPVVLIEARGILVRNQVSSLLKNLFTHLLRNSMDHGLEDAATRQALGKPAAGRINLDLSLANDTLTIRLLDDGRGIAIAKIRERGLARQMLTHEQAVSAKSVAMLIFASGFSTAEQVTEVSGRGVGMEAVKGFLHNAGGAIDVRFLDETEADYRQFELLITLPAKFAVVSDPAPIRAAATTSLDAFALPA